MKLENTMTRKVEVIRPGSTVREAAQMMRSLDVGPIPVVEDGRLIGMLTDRDITIRATAEGRDPNNTPVRDVMSPEVVFCYSDEDVETAAKLMSEKRIRRLPVMDRERKLVGIVSLADLAIDVHDQKMSGKVLADVSKPGHPPTR